MENSAINDLVSQLVELSIVNAANHINWYFSDIMSILKIDYSINKDQVDSIINRHTYTVHKDESSLLVVDLLAVIKLANEFCNFDLKQLIYSLTVSLRNKMTVADTMDIVKTYFV